ncbi:nuclease-related domain-containing protein [Ammoniphilus sp. YIM 78166]|uniref:nuclease-related domain-containing protein n=1 Tax=Ammoniphilus sp. YIM 78166 TaxID=1644106 RepID=UPI001430B7FD|nr:nuclease-related domain-containing protein [Ammoniphilus sp. YIM 78166]
MRKKSRKILALEALLRRIPLDHPKREEIATYRDNLLAGYHGETQVDYYLQLLPESNSYTLLQALRLPLHNTTFQIDTLLITPTFMLNIESKNISGILKFSQSPTQCTRIKDEKETGYIDPIEQADIQCRQLRRWLEFNNIKPGPIEFLVAISNPSTIVQSSTPQSNLIHVVHLPKRIQLLEAKYKERFITPSFQEKLTELLRERHQPEPSTMHEKYNISPNEIIKGLQCPVCSHFSMLKKQRGWHCLKCKALSKEAHVQAIEDYFLLFNSTLTNQQCRDFLLLDCRYKAKRILANMNLPTQNNTKGRTYATPPHLTAYKP